MFFVNNEDELEDALKKIDLSKTYAYDRTYVESDFKELYKLFE